MEEEINYLPAASNLEFLNKRHWIDSWLFVLCKYFIWWYCRV